MMPIETKTKIPTKTKAAISILIMIGIIGLALIVFPKLRTSNYPQQTNIKSY